MQKEGIPASPGIAIGRVFLLAEEDMQISREIIKNNEVEAETARFLEAVEQTRIEIDEIKEMTPLQKGLR